MFEGPDAAVQKTPGSGYLVLCCDGPSSDLPALGGESLLEGVQDPADHPDAGVVPHHADPPHLASGGAQPARDLHQVVLHAVALFPITPILHTLPAGGPSPPEISTRWFFMQWPATACQLTPSGTLMVVTVGSLAAASGTNSSRPRLARPEWRWSAQRRWRRQQFSRPSSATTASPSLRAYMALTGPVWWYTRPLSGQQFQYSPSQDRSR